jgi:hypothetical protein
MDRSKAPLLPRYPEMVIGSLTGLAPAPGVDLHGNSPGPG